MSIQSFTHDMNIISKLDDEPNDVGGLTASELKSKFDEGGLALKAYLNDTLIPDVRREITGALQDAVAGIVPGITVIIPQGETVPAESRVTGNLYWQVLSAL